MLVWWDDDTNRLDAVDDTVNDDYDDQRRALRPLPFVMTVSLC